MMLVCFDTMYLAEFINIYRQPNMIFISLCLMVAFFPVFGMLVCKRKKDTECSLHIMSIDTLESIDYLDSVMSLKDWEKLSRSQKNIELNNDLAPWGFAYYLPKDLFYSRRDGWQRNCGYCRFYDRSADTFCMIIDSEPIYFNYAGKNWLVEFWKGQYGMTTGCEIGIYNTTGPLHFNKKGQNETFYYCVRDNEQIFMSYSLKKNDKIIMSRGETHWWLTSFILGEFSQPYDLIMNAEVKLFDYTMTEAFIEGMLKAGYTSDELTIRGKSVSFTFDRPRTPINRSPIIDQVMQTVNHRNCLAYQFAGERVADNTLDRLFFVKRQAPKLYRKIMDLGKCTRLLKDCDKIVDIITDLDENDDKLVASKVYGSEFMNAYNSSIQIESLKLL